MQAKSNNDTAQVIRRTVYDYQDEAGKLIYQVIRKDMVGGGKDFSQRRADGTPTIAGIAPVPYHLPDVMSIIRRGGLVFIVEGEKCADTLNAAFRSANIRAIATCNNGGAGHWGAEQSKWLESAKVCLLPDNDEPGRRHVEIAARALTDRATSIKRLELPDLPDKGDIADWLAAGHQISELQFLYHGADEYTPPVIEPPKPRPTAPVEHATGGEKRYLAWAQKALDYEVASLARLNDGRFEALKRVANRLGSIAARGWLTESECMSAIMDALETNGYTQKPGKRNGAAEKEARFYFRHKITPCDLPVQRPASIPYGHSTLKDEMPYLDDPVEPKWASGVPVVVRGLMNAYAPAAAGPTLELIVEGQAARIVPESFNVECLVYASDQLGRGLTEATIRRGLKNLTDPHGVEFLAKSVASYSLSREESKDIPDLQATDFVNNPCGCPGRTPDYYRLHPASVLLSRLARYIAAPLIKEAFPVESALVAPIRAEFLADLEIPDVESISEQLMDRYGALIEAQPGYRDAMKQVRRKLRRLIRQMRTSDLAPIPAGEPYASHTAYMGVTGLALVVAKGGEAQYTRNELCELMGCQDRAIKSLFDRVGVLIVKKQTVDVLLKDVDQLRSIRPGEYNRTVRGYPVQILSSKKKSPLNFDAPGMMTWAEGEAASGAALTVRYSQPNKQVLQPKAPDMEPILPRLAWGAVVFIRALLVKLRRWLALAQENEAIQEAADNADQESETEEPSEKVQKERYGDMLLRKAINKFTERKIKPGQTVDDTGEIFNTPAQLSLDVLFAHAPSPDDDDEPSAAQRLRAEVEADPLLSWIETELGGKVTAAERADPLPVLEKAA